MFLYYTINLVTEYSWIYEFFSNKKLTLTFKKVNYMKKLNGVLYALSSSAAFGLMPILAKFSYTQGATAVTVVFFRFLFSWILIFPMLLIKKRAIKITKREFVWVVLIGILGYASTTLTLFLSYNYISVGLATTIHFVYPVIVTLITTFFFKEKLNRVKLFSLILSTIGIYFLVFNGHIQLSFIGVFYAIFSGVLYSLYIVSISYSPLKNMDNLLVTFYLSMASSSAIFIFGTATKSIKFDLPTIAYVYILGISIISTVIAITAFQKGIKIIGPSNAAILSTFEPIVSMVLGNIILQEAFSEKILFGCLLIILSVITLTFASKK